jgi:2-(1,2-epoxy-1,2-dihydrophenyl)acetyl-CoA isomerase
MAEECVQALDDCARDVGIRVLLVTGAGRAFCSGGDVKMLKEALDKGDARMMQGLLRALGNLCLAIRNLPKLTLAVINGPVVGAGLNLALVCDLSIASTEARFRQAFANLGLIPDAGGTFFLPRLVGLRKASELVFLDETLTAQEALSLGLVNRLADPESLTEEAWALAEKIASGPTQAFGRAKELMQQGLSNDLAKQIELEIAAQREASKSADYREGLTAFLEKRTPDFTGR